ncbi:hypothetical protein [Piscirickettsia salmonis]|nr:hypothetical protein [Piscirickettsia salmonis]QGP39912.1 hypothetical protein Psal182_02071 [Piscirickettsia salmonis]
MNMNSLLSVALQMTEGVRMKLDQDEINLETALSQVMKSMSETIR